MSLLSHYINLPLEFYHLIFLTSIFLVCWHRSLWGQFLIDDDLGLQQFGDKFRPEHKDAQGNLVTELKVNYYNQETGKDDQGKPVITTFKNLEYNKSLGIPGAFMRWHRLHIGKKFQVIAKDKKGHEVYGFIQDPFRHHVWSLTVQLINVFLCYNFLSHLFGSNIAFIATALFSVHPVSCQTVAWLSGINYLYSLMFSLFNFNLVLLSDNYYLTIPLTVLLSFLSGMTLLTGCFNWVILVLMGCYWEAFASACVALIVFLRDGSEAINFRKKNFAQQNMAKSTLFNFRKPIVMLKTLFCYVCFLPVPKSLGLYWEYGYHYDEKMERMDWRFFGGLASLIIMVYFAITGPFIITFSVVWFLVYWLLFSNIITANQFVVDRYVFIPSLGYAIFLAYLLGPGRLFFFLLGLYMCRSMMHIWTFRSQKDFYLSNWLNFRKSEVALGNLGVCYINEGKSGTAIDTWKQATEINPFYDVAWYNLYSVFKSHGLLLEAKTFLEKCLNCKTVHFKDQWQKEYEALCDFLAKNPPQQPPNQIILPPK